MKILVRTSNSPLRNLGDIAMLIVCVRRLHEVLPEAELKIVIGNIEIFQKHFPDENPILSDGASALMRSRLFPIRSRWLSQGLWKEVERAESGVREHFPRLAYRLARIFAAQNGINRHHLDQFAAALFDSDAVVFAGGGILTDAFPEVIQNDVGFLNLVQYLGKPTAMFGHGLGPLAKPEFQKRTTAMLSRLARLTLREQKASLPLLETLGVPIDKVDVTGDDAIELGYEARRSVIGEKIGINLRQADYASVPAQAVAVVRGALACTLEKYSTVLIPLPVYVRPGPEDDHESIAKVCQGLPSDPPVRSRVTTVTDLIQRVGECRVVVTGSYHAGVFALAQGIPVVSLAKSAYYLNKFEGLADQFPGGCDVLQLDAPNLGEKLHQCIATRWRTAHETRDALLTAAKGQIDMGQAAYARFACDLRLSLCGETSH